MTADWNDRATAAIADAIGAVQQRFVCVSPTPTQLASAAMAALAPLLLERDAEARNDGVTGARAACSLAGACRMPAFQYEPISEAPEPPRPDLALEAEREAVARNWL